MYRQHLSQVVFTYSAFDNAINAYNYLHQNDCRFLGSQSESSVLGKRKRSERYYLQSRIFSHAFFRNVAYTFIQERAPGLLKTFDAGAPVNTMLARVSVH